jgi:hypothetical protein
MSYTISYLAHPMRHRILYRERYPFLLPLRFIQPVLPHWLRARASEFQLPCVLNPEHASASSHLHPPLRSFWGTPSRSSTSRGLPQKAGSLSCCRAWNQQLHRLEPSTAGSAELCCLCSRGGSMESVGPCQERFPRGTGRHKGLEAGRKPARTAWEYHSSACSCLE